MTVTDPHARSIAHATTWRQRMADALGTTTPLAGISALSLNRAVTHFRASPDPDAWIWATVCGAELIRRESPHRPVVVGSQAAAELAWREQRERRAAA